MSEQSREESLRSIVPRDMGSVEGLTFYRNVTRTIISDPDLVRVRDRTADGKALADIGYPPAKAYAVGKLLMAAAVMADPSLKLEEGAAS